MDNASKLRGLNYVEIILVALGMVLLYVLLAFFAPGGPLSTDVMWYTNVSLNGIKDPFILNRYFHVFLQAVFLRIAPTPLVGLQHYWAFLIAVTCGLIYLGARLFSNQGWVLHGLLAVALFFSIADIADTAGVAHVDITAMLMVILLTVLIIVSTRRKHASIWLLVLLGFFFYLAFRTKESTLPVAILLLGLGMSEDAPFSWRLFFRRLAYVLLGVLAGMIFFVVLNTIFVHDPLFGFRPADIQTFFSTYVSQAASATKQAGSNNWYTAYLFTSLLIPFVLYLVSAAKVAREVSVHPGIRLIWLLPLMVVIFVTITIGNQWGFIPRYFFPALPILCMLVPQFLNLDLTASSEKRERWQAILVFGIGIGLVMVIRLALRTFVPRLGWDILSFLEAVYIPVVLSVILALLFYYLRPSLVPSYLLTVLILAIIAIPLVNNVKAMVRDHPNLTDTQKLMYPFSAFSSQIRYTPEMRMYVAMDIWQEFDAGSYVKDRTELSSLFNIYFKSASVKTNFALSGAVADIPYELLSTNYTYGLLSLGDWKLIEQDSRLASSVEQKYQVIPDNQGLLVLVKLKQ